MRSVRVNWRLLAVGLAAVLPLAGCGGGPAKPVGVLPRTASDGGPVVRDYVEASSLLDRSHGWVLTPVALSMTDDGGRTWTRVTPRGVPVGQIAGVQFLTPRTAILARSQPDGFSHRVFSFYATEDAGLHWHQLPPRLTALTPDGSPPNPGYGWVDIDFLDARHGFVALAVEGPVQISAGDLYRTDNGGTTWRRASMLPVFGEIRFTNSKDGWLAGGSVHDRLYATHDGGRRWQPVAYETRRIVKGTVWASWLDTPVFSDREHGVLTTTLDIVHDPTGAKGDFPWLIFETSSDGGRSWHVAATLPEAGCCVGTANTVLGQDSWVAVTAEGGKVVHLTEAGKKTTIVTEKVLPLYRLRSAGGTVGHAEFVDQQHGWIEIGTGECYQYTPDCAGYVNLYATSDGGTTWRQLLSPDIAGSRSEHHSPPRG